MRCRDLAVALVVAAAANAVVSFGAFDWLRGLSADIVFWGRYHAFGPRHDSATSPTVVVAIDEETYRRPPFQGLPNVMWTPQLARVMRAVLAGGAKVVGYDLILPTSVERFVPGFDRDYLIALRDAARDGKVVLGKVQHQMKPISPFPGYSFAVGHQRNIRALNAVEDGDGVIRRLPLWFRTAGPDRKERLEPSMALELAARWLGVAPAIGDDGKVRLAGRTVTADSGGSTMIDFDGGPGTIPTYSLADLYACADAGRDDYFRQQFAGRAVLFGVVLDVEDRKLTSKRLMTGPDGVGQPPRCIVPPMQGLYRTDLRRDTMPGVYVAASAVNDLIRGDGIGSLGGVPDRAIAALLTLLAGVAVLSLSPLRGAAAVLAGAALWAVVAVVALDRALMLPFLDPVIAVVVAVTALFGYRFAVADRDKAFLRRAFSLYLPASEVERLAESAVPPSLGGEVRELTVLVSDVEGFSAIAEGLAPPALVARLNAYLALVTEAVEAHGGFVDKYTGDGVIAVFGAPIADPDHARHAVEAALAIQRATAADGAAAGSAFRTRIGINSGEMLVGNIGGRRRFNYTVIGDAVNLAARIEGANKAFATRTLASERTRALCGAAWAFRAIDRVRVVGRAQAVELFEPLGAAAGLGSEARERLAAWDAALGQLRDRRFAEAAAGFERFAPGDAVAAGRAAFARRLAADPAAGWDGVSDLDRK